MPSPFATQEDPQSLWYEQSTYDSAHLASVGYGIHVAVYSTVTYIMLQERLRYKRMNTQTWIGWLIFNTFLFAMGTINLACSIHFNQNAWINDREYPGGPYAYLIEEQILPIMTLGNVTSILASFLADALLLYRAAILWNYLWYIIIPPAMFYVVCVILSILTVVQIALPTQVHWEPLSLAVWIILMIMPMWLSVLIAGRIWYQKTKIVNNIGTEDLQTYTGVSAIIIESAAPFTVLSIILLGLFGSNNIAQNLFVPLLVQVECIAPEMIILRVMLGRAWTRHTIARGEDLTQIEFATVSQNPPGISTFATTMGNDQGTSSFMLTDDENHQSAREDKEKNISNETVAEPVSTP